MTSFEQVTTSNQIFDYLSGIGCDLGHFSLLKDIEDLFGSDVMTTKYSSASGQEFRAYVLDDDMVLEFARYALNDFFEAKLLDHFNIEEGCEDLI